MGFVDMSKNMQDAHLGCWNYGGGRGVAPDGMCPHYPLSIPVAVLGHKLTIVPLINTQYSYLPSLDSNSLVDQVSP